MQLGIFVSHSFHDKHHILNVEEFRSTVSNVCDSISSQMCDLHNERLSFSIYFADQNYGKSLPTSIRSQIQKADIFIMDIAGASPNIFYELGYAHSHGLELSIFEAVTSSPAPIPTDISDLLIGRYTSLPELVTMLRERFLKSVEARIIEFRRSTGHNRRRCFWFDENVSEIHVICAPEPERTRFAEVDSSDYLYLDNLDDRDALFEVSTYLSRSYPNAKILRHAAGKVSSDVLDSNIVLLGGPRNNTLTKDLSDALAAKYEYADNDNSLKFLKSPDSVYILPSVKDTNDMLTTDVGYFGRFLNPFNRKNHLVMCHGSHTFGTLAACLLFADSNQAQDNWRHLVPEGSDPFALERIECVFQVRIMGNRRIFTPPVEAEHLITI
jgi:hypothetical protein